MDFKKFQIQFLDNLNTSNISPELKEEIRPIGGLEVRAVLDIYKKDYLFRLSEALGEFFESIWFVLGDETFFQVAREFIEQNPSTTQDLSLYGRAFPHFLNQSPHLVEFPFLFELAQLEQSYWDFFHDKNVPYDDPWDALNSENFEDVKFLFPKGTQVLSSNFKIVTIFQARKVKLEDSFDWNQPEHALMYKSFDQVRLMTLTQGQKIIMENLLKGLNISDSLDVDIEINPEEVSSLFRMLKEQQIQVEFSIC